MENTSDARNARLIAIDKRLEEEARPKVESYIRQQGWKDAKIINRFVIQNGDHYFVQTVNGVQEITLEKNNQYFSVNTTKMDSWLEEDEASKILRGYVNKISNIKAKSVSIGSINVGREGVNMDYLKIEHTKDFKFQVPGDELRTVMTPVGIKFEIVE